MTDARPLVLIVDDQPINLKLLAEALDPAFAVKVATNGPDALARAAREPYPDVILLDVMMPGMDGYEVCAALKDNPATASIPVIFITARTDGESESQALAGGAADFVGKPINPTAVRLRVDLQVRLRQREQALRNSKQQLEMALEAAAMGIWDYDVATGRLSWTERQAGLLGLPASVEGATLREMRCYVHPQDRRSCLASLHRTQRDGTPFDQIFRALWADGSTHWLHSLAKLTCDERGRPCHIIGTTRDISALKDHQRQLERMAHFDPLTALPNRALLGERLGRAMAHAERYRTLLAVAYIDLDGFKRVNDTHGHAVGDELLVRISKRMSQNLRQVDTLARLGGDELVAVLVDLADEEACEALVGRLLAAAAKPVLVGELEVKVTASIGITFFPQPQDVDGDQLLRQADHSMYRAKQLGKNRFFRFDQQSD